MRISNTDASKYLLALIILLFVVGVALAIYTLRSNPVDDAIAANRIINTLFVIEDNKKPVSTYVLMFFPATRRAAVFDIPGNLGIMLPRVSRVDRIDSVYDPTRIAGYQNMVERLLGIEITFNIVITTENLVSMVDLLEGVEIFIPSPVSYRDEKMFILFPSGITVLDGDKAGVYAAYSLPDEDREIQIFRRQRFFMGLLGRWIRMNDMLKESATAKLYYSLFRTGMNQRTFMRLFDEFTNIDTDRTNIQSVGGSFREVSGEMLIIPHWDGNLIKEIVRQTMGMLTREIEDPFSDRPLTVEILNGTAINGLAGRTADMLRSFGFDIVSVGNADRNNYDSTVILHRSGDESRVRAFADVIRCTNIRREIFTQDDLEENMDIHSLTYRADITLILGRNFNGRYVTGN